MATSALVPVSEYLTTVYEPDCDYVDGEVQERNLGERDHGDLQARLLELLRTAEGKTFFDAVPELRVQVKPTRFRVPDVTVLRKGAPREQIVQTPPLLCIEILSPEDRMYRTRERVRDYFEMGVPEVWIIDPIARTATICRGASMVEQTDGALTVPETPITFALADIFSVFDDYRQ